MKQQGIRQLTGKVRWFDRLSGEGVICDLDSNQQYWVYACNIIGAKTAFPHTACMFLEQGQVVEFQVIEGCESCGACHVTRGHFDAEHWEHIRHKDLAFRLNDDGSFASGLFK